MAISWLQGDDAAVRSHFTKVERIPKALEVTESPLVKAVFHACRAMHASLPGKADGQQSSFCHCERASGHLWSSLNVSGTTSDSALNHVVQLLTCDLLLSLRTTLWQKQASASQAVGETYHASGAELAGFQRDLGSLRRLAHSFRPAYRKVFLHEATVRLMAGASPTRTHQLLNTACGGAPHRAPSTERWMPGLASESGPPPSCWPAATCPSPSSPPRASGQCYWPRLPAPWRRWVTGAPATTASR